MLLAADPIARTYSGKTMVIISRAVASFSLTMLRKYPEGNVAASLMRGVFAKWTFLVNPWSRIIFDEADCIGGGIAND